VLGHDHLQGGDGIARCSQRQHELGPPLPRHHPEFVEPDGFGLGERPVGELGQRGAAPHGQGRVDQLESLPADRPGGGSEGIGEPGGVELTPPQTQPVPAAVGDQPVAGRAKDAPQAGNLRAQRAGRILGQVGTPQLVDEPVRGHQLVGIHEQNRQHQALASAGERDHAIIHPRLDRAQQPVPPHGHQAPSPGLL
jgi:hypothetical protein